MRFASLVVLFTAAGIATAAAQDMHSPKLTRSTVDWNAATARLAEIEGQQPDALAQLNSATADLFTSIATSPVPVLLPFDTETLLRDRASGKLEPAAGYLTGFGSAPFFQTGPGGYDAAFSFFAKDLPGIGVSFSGRIDIQMSGAALLYDVEEPSGLIEWPAKELEAEFPGLRRYFVESVVRYSFVRYGVPYVVAIECSDGGARNRKPSCRDADKLAARFLRSLQVAGGAPAAASQPPDVNTIDRPQAESTVFTYYSPGDLQPGSGMKGHNGRADYTVYSRIRFPIEEAPAFANSQSFMNWGDCDQTGRVSMGRQGNTAAYRCRVNNVPLIADESANYAYPWRDNFCEHRYFFVGACPGGLGHQGQDIRPSSCKQRIAGANRCEPYQHGVVAVRDGIVLRSPGQVAFYVVANATNERIRFRYLHLFPKFLDRDGVFSGRVVREGEEIGKVGNYFRRERATTYHLHFDVQVPTRYGWVFVNPYMTLVAAYERQIQGRGRELRQETVPVVAGPTVETPAVTTENAEGITTTPPAETKGPAVVALPASGESLDPAITLESPTKAADPDESGKHAPTLDRPATTAVNPNEMDVQSETTGRIVSETAHDGPRHPAAH